MGTYFLCLGESICYLAIWLMLELISFAVTPHFFFEVFPCSQRALLQYLIVSGISSFFLVAGALIKVYHYILIGLGVVIKLGVFPFMG